MTRSTTAPTTARQPIDLLLFFGWTATGCGGGAARAVGPAGGPGPVAAPQLGQKAAVFEKGSPPRNWDRRPRCPKRPCRTGCNASKTSLFSPDCPTEAIGARPDGGVPSAL